PGAIAAVTSAPWGVESSATSTLGEGPAPRGGGGGRRSSTTAASKTRAAVGTAAAIQETRAQVEVRARAAAARGTGGGVPRGRVGALPAATTAESSAPMCA